MRMIMLRMLTTSSLSALSAIQPPSAHPQTGPVTRVRAPVPPQNGSAGGGPDPSPAVPPPAGGTPPGTTPGSRILPRGSLLDLSV
jgi:hypothetical protein